MRPFVVVAVDPRPDDADHVIEVVESVLPYAFAFERFVIGLDDAVLLRRVRMNELLLQAVRPQQMAIESRGEDKTRPLSLRTTTPVFVRGRIPKVLRQASSSAQTAS